MKKSKAAFEFFQFFSYGWFCAGVFIVGFLAIRDLIRMMRKRKERNS